MAARSAARAPVKLWRETTFPVSGVGEIEAGFAFEHSLAARNALSCQTHGKQRIAHGRTFAHGATATANALEIARSQVHALSESTVHVLGTQAHDLRNGRRGAEDAEHGTDMKSACHDGRHEIRSEPFHDLIASHDASQEIPARAARGFGGHERRGQDRAAGVRDHTERVPFAAGEHHLRVDEGSPGTRERASVDKHSGIAGAALLLVLHQANGLFRLGKPIAEQTGRQGLQRHAASAVLNLGRDVRIGEPRHPT